MSVLLLLAMGAHAGEARDLPQIELAASALIYENRAANQFQARLVGERDAYALVEARLAPSGWTVGRLGVGVDILGGASLDLRVGLWMGGEGDWSTGTMFGQPGVGTEIAVAKQFHRVYAHARWMTASIAGDFRLGHEHEVLVGYRVKDELRLFGQVVHEGRRRERSGTGIGLGVGYSF